MPVLSKRKTIQKYFINSRQIHCQATLWFFDSVKNILELASIVLLFLCSQLHNYDAPFFNSSLWEVRVCWGKWAYSTSICFSSTYNKPLKFPLKSGKQKQQWRNVIHTQWVWAQDSFLCYWITRGWADISGGGAVLGLVREVEEVYLFNCGCGSASPPTTFKEFR